MSRLRETLDEIPDAIETATEYPTERNRHAVFCGVCAQLFYIGEADYDRVRRDIEFDPIVRFVAPTAKRNTTKRRCVRTYASWKLPTLVQRTWRKGLLIGSVAKPLRWTLSARSRCIEGAPSHAIDRCQSTASKPAYSLKKSALLAGM